MVLSGLGKPSHDCQGQGRPKDDYGYNADFEKAAAAWHLAFDLRWDL